MTDDAPEPSHEERSRVASGRSPVATARTKAEELQRRSLERLELESERRSWVRMLVDAYTADPLAIDMTDLGKLQGEIALGYYRVRRLIEDIPGFPPELEAAVLHIILSHHGQLEHGSPVVPCTREATLVHMIDNLGGRLGSFDRLEKELLRKRQISVADMRQIDEFGVGVLISRVIDKVRARNGVLHVSFDVDFLDPEVAPGVGTTVPGGATYREAHLIMELLHDSGLVCSVDIVELNPFLDERGRTARTAVELIGSLFGQQIIDRPTPSNAIVPRE